MIVSDPLENPLTLPELPVAVQLNVVPGTFAVRLIPVLALLQLQIIAQVLLPIILWS